MSEERDEIPKSIRDIFDTPAGQFKPNPAELYEINFPRKQAKLPPGMRRVSYQYGLIDDGKTFFIGFSEPLESIQFDKQDAMRFAVMVNQMVRSML